MESIRIVILVAGLLACVVGIPLMVYFSFRQGMYDDKPGQAKTAAFNALAELDKVIRPSAEHRIEAENKVADEEEIDGA